jgi:hypothetical protein
LYALSAMLSSKAILSANECGFHISDLRTQISGLRSEIVRGQIGVSLAAERLLRFGLALEIESLDEGFAGFQIIVEELHPAGAGRFAGRRDCDSLAALASSAAWCVASPAA